LAIRLFDSLTRRKVELEPRNPPHLGVYVCGVTVYDRCHLGHARVYVVWDTVIRHLRARGYDVTYVRNITDVDDKIIQRAGERGISTEALVEETIAEMQRDFDALGVLPPDVEPRATRHIPEMIAHIEGLIAQGTAYVSEGDVYFAVDRFADYGALSGQSIDELRAGARVEPGEKKRNPLDFALWKAAKPGEPFWEAPWGRGRPGWHIECSAMSSKYLGPSFDIHTGGPDLLFPHHQNEIAQSQSLTGPGTFSKYWMHNGYVNLRGEKMAKSTGNVVWIRQVTERHDAEALRLYLLSIHYRSPINIEIEARDGNLFLPGVAEAERRLEYFYTTLQRLDDLLADARGEDRSPLVDGFGEAMDDDFNSAVALATMGEAATRANQLLDEPKAVPKAERRSTLLALRQGLRQMGDELGLLARPPQTYLLARRARLAAARRVDEAQVDELLSQRAQARAAKNFARADEIRTQLAERDIEVMDTPAGTRWRFRD